MAKSSGFPKIIAGGHGSMVPAPPLCGTGAALLPDRWYDPARRATGTLPDLWLPTPLPARIVHSGFIFRMILIRPATTADHPALAGIFISSRRHAFPWEDPRCLQTEDFEAQTEGEVIRLAEEASTGQPLGFISVWTPERFIHHLFVHPARLGQGIGRLLLDDLASWLPHPWRLKCKTANQAAHGFYLHLGWRELCRVDDPTGEYALMEFGATA
ncbi:MAG: N-acetyltransferase [Verrucomicrobiaceae bacterium]|nr:MAG: N-acetyltransferase [Verrucomicrobiaceae bacterium]